MFLGSSTGQKIEKNIYLCLPHNKSHHNLSFVQSVKKQLLHVNVQPLTPFQTHALPDLSIAEQTTVRLTNGQTDQQRQKAL